MRGFFVTTLQFQINFLKGNPLIHVFLLQEKKTVSHVVNKELLGISEMLFAHAQAAYISVHHESGNIIVYF